MPGATSNSEEEPVTKRIIKNAGFVAIVAAALLTGCGGGDDADPAAEVASLGTEPADDVEASAVPRSSVPTDPEEAQLAFAECMREHGIDMPDPGQAEGGMMIQRDASDGDQEEFEAAMADCERFLDAVRSEIADDPELQAEMQEQMLEFTECMRDHGIDMPDPQFGDDGDFTVQFGGPDDGGPSNDASGSDGVSPADDPEFQDAAEECGGGMTVAAGPVSSAPVGGQD
jgi:hypothetical protein